MVGYPKYLNTKDDYEFVRKNFPKDMWQSAFESLLDTRRDWFSEGEITGTSITDEIPTPPPPAALTMTLVSDAGRAPLLA